MPRIGMLLSVLSLPLALSLITGCGGSSTKTPSAKKEVIEPPDITLLKAKGWTSLSGIVAYDGDPPKLEEDPRLSKHNDSTTCCAESAKALEKARQTWIVDPKTKGVANVVVFLKPPDDKYFDIHDDDKTRSDTKFLGQPHCAYLPHVFVLYPEYYDGNENLKTGEKFTVKNNAPISHNTKFTTDPAAGNSALGKTIPIGTDWQINTDAEVRLHPQDGPVVINCDVHKWMTAYGWVFDHPYAAVTKGGNLEDKSEDFGKFKIPRVPAGVPVRVVVWHEGRFLNSQGFNGAKGKEMTFEEGKEATLEIKLKK